MPKLTKISSKKTKRRVYKKKAKQLNVPKPMVAFGRGLPLKCIVTHRYFEPVSINCSSGVLNKYLFSCNGMYDPNFSGGGHQPMYFDQFAALYDQYVVIGSKINVKVTFHGNTQYAANVGIYINDDTTQTPTDLNSLVEHSSASYKMLAPQNTKVTTLSKTWSAKKIFGKGVMSNNSLQGNATSNPSEQSFYNIFVQPLDQISTQSYYVEASIEYTAIWNELRDIQGS